MKMYSMHFIPESITVTLPDGQKVLLREVRTSDRERALAAFDKLSVESVYFRFWNDLLELSESMLDRLTKADQINHIVWCALNPDDIDEPGYGAASLWRFEDDPTMAEVSFTVLDEYQSRGIGTLLLAVMWLLAEKLDINMLRANVLAENKRAIDWLLDIGGRAVENRGVCEIDILLDESEDVQTERRAVLLRWLQLLRGEFG